MSAVSQKTYLSERWSDTQLEGIRVWVKPERFVKAFIQWPNLEDQSTVAGK